MTITIRLVMEATPPNPELMCPGFGGVWSRAHESAAAALGELARRNLAAALNESSGFHPCRSERSLPRRG